MRIGHLCCFACVEAVVSKACSILSKLAVQCTLEVSAKEVEKWRVHVFYSTLQPDI